MGLFRRKHKPWDEFFNVITEFPSTNPDGMSFDFPIPYYYHAKLIHISFTYFLSGVLPVLSRAAALTVSRGNNVITRGKWPAFSTQGFSVLYFSSVGALHSASQTFGQIICSTPLPEPIYLYPDDLIKVFFPLTLPADIMSEPVLTLQQWVTS